MQYAARTRLSHRAFRGETWLWRRILLVKLDSTRHSTEKMFRTCGKGMASHSEKGGQGFFVLLEAEERTRVVERKHKRPVNGGALNQKGSERQRQRQVNSDQTRKPSLESRSHCMLLRRLDQKDQTLTVVMGNGTQGLYGYSASCY